MQFTIKRKITITITFCFSVFLLSFLMVRLLNSPSINVEDIFTIQENFSPYQDSLQRSKIPILTDPIFDSVGVADSYLKNNGLGIALTWNGEDHYYPLQILGWHGLVYDKILGQSVTIVYLPEVGISVAYLTGTEKLKTLTKTWKGIPVYTNQNNVLEWNPVSGRTIDDKTFNQRLPIIIERWDNWSIRHANGYVLSRKTGFDYDYAIDPFQNSSTNRSTWREATSGFDDRLPVDTKILGFVLNKKTFAVPFSEVKKIGFWQGEIDGLNIVLWYDVDTDSIRAFYPKKSNGTPLTFEHKSAEVKDMATESVWRSDGRAVIGPLVGTYLELVPTESAFWWSWSTTYPETELIHLP